METAYDLLAAQPFLAGLTPRQLDKLSYWSKRRVFHAGARLFDEGGRADRFWLIKEGQITLDAAVPGRGSVVVETLGPAAVLGWSWLFPPYRWHFGAAAAQTTLATELDGPGVRELCQRDPELGYQLASRFTQVVVARLQATRIRLLDLYRAPGPPIDGQPAGQLRGAA
ncbi:MAG: cyclic nucleotide-binding domain-containing protein [Micromonosporaceae bacterium]|nr:cyclic nucleotide-binding domain-containing protein [Micromonosporaceae bacterium]